MKGVRDSNCSRPRLYDLKAAAKYLGRPVWGVRELVWKGVLPAVRDCDRGKQYIDLEDLEAYVALHKVAAPTVGRSDKGGGHGN
jgi:hypothetical protein